MIASINNEYLSECSMGTQTDVLPKTTYKELKTQRFLARITAQLEINECDRVGNSSGYLKKTVNTKIAVPEQYKDEICNARRIDNIENTNEYKWANHLPNPTDYEYNYNCLHNCNCKAGAINGVGAHQYRYTIQNVVIVKNNKYVKEAIAEPDLQLQKTPRQRKRISKDIVPAPAVANADPETELNKQIKEIQGQLKEIQGQAAEAEKVYINICLQRTEAEKAVEEKIALLGEANAKKAELLQKEDKIKIDLEKLKIEFARKTNKNGYVILAHDDYEGKEEVYGHAQKFEDALSIAKEAITTGKKRKNKNIECKDECIVGEKVEAQYVKNDKWYGATISKNKKIWEKGKQISKIDIVWDDGINAFNRDLNLDQIRKLTKYNRFNSARIVDLDTHTEVEEFGVYMSDKADYSW